MRPQPPAGPLAAVRVLGRPACQVFGWSQALGKGGTGDATAGPGSRYPWCLGGPTDSQKIWTSGGALSIPHLPSTAQNSLYRQEAPG